LSHDAIQEEGQDMDSNSESSGALNPLVPAAVTVPAPEAAVADLVDAAADVHHRIRTALKRLASRTTAQMQSVLQYGAPDLACLETGLEKARCDMYRARGSI
jgi:hypothetical protein